MRRQLAHGWNSSSNIEIMEKEMTADIGRQRFIFASVVLVFLLADWLSKRLFQGWLETGGPIDVIPGFRLILVHNHGAAFGFLASAGGWQRGLFIFVAAAVIIYLAWRLWMARSEEKLTNIGFAMILGGAAGNLIDRVRHGYVVDFIDIYVRDWHWPAFNVADAAISIGALVVIFDSLGLFRIHPSKPSQNGAP
jgi:signal peptidase II